MKAKMNIRIKNGRWTVNGKLFKDLTLDEIKILSIFIESFKIHEHEIID